MPAKLQFPSIIPKPFKGLHVKSKAASKPLWLLALATIIALAAWANTAWTSTRSPTTATALAPALKLAIGTVKLEGTDQAVDSTAAAKLLPLWELLEQLDTSGYAAPEEITAVVEEIQLNMTSAQIKAISAMSIDQSQLGLTGGAAPSTGTSSTQSSAQAASIANDPALGGVPGDAPIDGGGPMPSGGSQTTASGSKTSGTSASSAVIKQVIQTLQDKLHS